MRFQHFRKLFHPFRHVYVLKGDLYDWDYQVYGTYTTFEQALVAADKVAHKYFSLDEINNIMSDFDFCGLVVVDSTLDSYSAIDSYEEAISEVHELIAIPYENSYKITSKEY